MGQNQSISFIPSQMVYRVASGCHSRTPHTYTRRSLNTQCGCVPVSIALAQQNGPKSVHFLHPLSNGVQGGLRVSLPYSTYINESGTDYTMWLCACQHCTCTAKWAKISPFPSSPLKWCTGWPQGVTPVLHIHIRVGL